MPTLSFNGDEVIHALTTRTTGGGRDLNQAGELLASMMAAKVFETLTASLAAKRKDSK